MVPRCGCVTTTSCSMKIFPPPSGMSATFASVVPLPDEEAGCRVYCRLVSARPSRGTVRRNDPAHPELDRIHPIDWFTDRTDPRLVLFEPDTMHTLAGRGALPRSGGRAPLRRQRLVWA